MDREIPKEVRQKERNKKIIRYSSIGVASIIAISVLISVLRAGVEAKDLVFSTVDNGVIEVVSALPVRLSLLLKKLSILRSTVVLLKSIKKGEIA